MKKHWFGIIGYLLGIFLLWACIIIFQQPFLYMLLFLLIILPLLSVICFMSTASKLQVDLYSDVPSVETGNTVTFILECKNDSYLPLYACNYDFKLQNLYKPNDKTNSLSLPLMPRRANKIQVPVETAIAGQEKSTNQAERYRCTPEAYRQSVLFLD